MRGTVLGVVMGVLLGCAGPAPLVAEDPALGALLADAAEAWRAAGVEPPPVASSGPATVHWGDCPLPGPEALGCVSDGEIWLSPSLEDELSPLAPRALQHELGHWIRGDGAHLPIQSAVGVLDGCQLYGRGPDLMCSGAGPAITAREPAR